MYKKNKRCMSINQASRLSGDFPRLSWGYFGGSTNINPALGYVTASTCVCIETDSSISSSSPKYLSLFQDTELIAVYDKRVGRNRKLCRVAQDTFHRRRGRGRLFYIRQHPSNFTRHPELHRIRKNSLKYLK